VASRIGAVRGDVIGIEILERGAGRAIDELVIELPASDLVPLLVEEVSQVDGVDIEDVRELAAPLHDVGFDALCTAAELVEQTSVDALLEMLADHVRGELQADWAVVVDVEDGAPAATVGQAPPGRWLHAFVAGGRASPPLAVGEWGPDDVAWAHLPAANLALVMGRSQRAFRSRERRRLLALARIANHRWVELSSREAKAIHPSAS